MCCSRCACLLILCAAIIPACTSGASFTVDKISLAGSDDVYPGDIVRVSGRVSFDATGEVTFPGGDMLQLSTKLGEPEWEYTLFVDNNPVQNFSRESGVVFINGYYLEYAQGRSEYLYVEVTGTIPEGEDDGLVDALTITQYDEYGNVRGDGVATIPVTVHTKNESVQPEPTHVPESASPVPTKSPLNGFICAAGILSAFAAIPGKK